MEGEILNPVHVKNPLEDQNAATTAGQSTQVTPVLNQSSKSTLFAPVALDVPESAKPTSPADAALGSPESAEPTLAGQASCELCAAPMLI